MTVLATFKLAYSVLDKKQKKLWLKLLPISLFQALMEALGATMIFTLIRAVSDPRSVATLPIIGKLAVAHGWIGSPALVPMLGVGIAVFTLLKNTFALFQQYASHKAASATGVVLAARLLHGYLAAPYAMHLRRNSADLLRTVWQSVDGGFRMVIMTAVTLTSETTVGLTLLCVLGGSAPGMTAVFVSILGVVTYMIFKATNKRLKQLGTSSHGQYGDLVAGLQQSLGGVKELKILGREKFFVDEHEKIRRNLAVIQWKHGTLESAPRLMLETLFIFVIVGMVGMSFATDTSRDIVPILGLFGYVGMRILPSAHRAVWHVNEVNFRSKEVMGLVRDWNQYVKPRLNAEGEFREETPKDTVSTFSFQRAIEFQNVSYIYEGAAKASLRNCRLVIRKGETVAIVGPTGAGKSTTLDVLLGLLSPTEGKVMVDDLPLETCLRAFQRKIGYVPQSIYIFDDTLRKNVALGLNDPEIDDARVMEALKLAQIDRLLDDMPEGLNTKVGERGVRLSGGERQRLAVARALYHRPEILVFDEATSAIDNETEAALTQSIESLGGDRTLIVVAHRLATVKRADRLVYLQRGQVVDEGTFQELLERNESFRRMAQEEAKPKPEGAPAEPTAEDLLRAQAAAVLETVAAE